MMKKLLILAVGSALLCGATGGRASAAFLTLSPSGSITRTITTVPGTTPPSTTTYASTVGPSAGYTTFANYFYGRFGEVTFAQTGDFIVKYNLSSLVAANVTAATLDFTITNSFYSGAVYVNGFGSTTPAGVQGDFTGTTVIGSASTFVSLTNVSTGTMRSLDAGFIKSLLSAGITAVAFQFQVGSVGSLNGTSGGVNFSTPTLNVTTQPAAVPEPSSLALCGIASLAIGTWARRRATASA